MWNAGDCFLLETNLDKGGKRKAHLFVVILSLHTNSDKTITVHVQSIRSLKDDRTTILKPGDHDFITHDSYINYRMAKIVSLESLSKVLAENKSRTKPSMQQDVFERICKGIMNSPFTPHEVKQLYEDYLYQQLKS
jgi:hypothetical protein